MRRGTVFVSALALMVLSLLFNCGCLFFPQYPESYAYVLKMKEPQRMTEWTLKQTEEGRIRDGMQALSAVGRRWPENHLAREQADEGYLRVHAKLRAGWPGFTADPNVLDSDKFGDLPAEVNERHRELTVRFGYLTATYVSGSVWEQLKPSPQETARLAAWTAAGRDAGWLKPDTRQPTEAMR